MMNFFRQIKNRISKDDSQPVYRQYTHGELKIISMRTRMIFEDLYKKESAKITQADTQFKKIQTSNGTLQQQYEVLQQIGKKVIETEMIKLYIEILRKIQAYAPQIINTKGDVALMKQQIKWFQCILWYRKCKKLSNIDEINTFCWNFFKGVDITMELNLKCELFKIYQGLQYLDDDLIIPLDFAVEKFIPYVSFQIGQAELNEMKKINQEEIRNKEEEEKRKRIQENPFFKLPVNQNSNLQQGSQNIPIQSNQISHPVSQPQNQNKKRDYLPVIPTNQIHPKQPQNHPTNNYTKLPVQDDQFASDPHSRVHKQNPNKSFKSNDLNLIDWQAMYRKEQSHEENPYINNSKIGLLNPDYSMSSEQNSYDENTLPYPSSGVISVENIDKKNDFFIDTLPCHEPQPVESHLEFQKKPQKKVEDDSFIKSIENQFFSTGSPQQNNIHAKPFRPSIPFNEEDLLKEVQSSQTKSQKPAQSQGKKSLNRLFGFKFKSNLDQQSDKPQPSPFGSSSQNYGQNNQDSSKSHTNQIDDLLNEITNDLDTKKRSHEVKESDLDEILTDLNINSVQQQKDNTAQNRFSVDDMLRDLNINSDSNKNDIYQPQNQKQNQHLDEDIRSLIESHKRSLKRKSSKDSSDDQFQKMEEQAQNQEGQFNAYQYPDDGERFKDSKIKFSQEMELLDEFQSQLEQEGTKQSLDHKEQNSNPEIQKQLSSDDSKSSPQKQFDYGSLEKDLLDSLKIIKNHFGEEVPSQQNSQDNDSKPEAKLIKKPYMVSIYARNEFMDGLKLAKHQSY